VNWVDWVILAIAGAMIFAGLLRGAVRTVLSLAGVVVGFLVASQESGAVGMVMERWMPEPAAAVVGFLFVFVGVAVVFALVGYLLRRILEGLQLGWADRVLGAGLGFLEAGVALGVAALVVEGFGSFEAAHDSKVYPYALQSGRILLGAIPDDTLERLRWDELRETIPELLEAVKDAEAI
jgi:membrane protein required for colicin V production